MSPFPSAHMEPWQWLYLALIALAGLRVLDAAIVSLDVRVRDLPAWIVLPAAFGFVLLHPWALIATFALHFVLLGAAPLGASVIAAIATVGSIVAFAMSIAPRSSMMVG